jgi:hypothetical protein
MVSITSQGLALMAVVIVSDAQPLRGTLSPAR